jgi:hypothetical protein
MTCGTASSGPSSTDRAILAVAASRGIHAEPSPPEATARPLGPAPSRASRGPPPCFKVSAIAKPSPTPQSRSNRHLQSRVWRNYSLDSSRSEPVCVGIGLRSSASHGYLTRTPLVLSSPKQNMGAPWSAVEGNWMPPRGRFTSAAVSSLAWGRKRERDRNATMRIFFERWLLGFGWRGSPEFLGALPSPPRQYAQLWTELVTAKFAVRTSLSCPPRPCARFVHTRMGFGRHFRRVACSPDFSAVEVRRRRRVSGQDWEKRWWSLILRWTPQIRCPSNPSLGRIEP